MKFGALTLAAATMLAFGLAAPSTAQEPSFNAQIASVSDDGFPALQVVVNIEDSSSGAPLTLDAGDFTATLDGEPAPVTAATLASSGSAPLDVVVIVDTSGSMEGAPLAQAKTASKAFIAGLEAEDRVAVMNFGDAVTLAQDYTADKALANAAIDGLVALGNTALYQATADGAKKAASSTANRRAVVLLSDGADFGGKSVVSRDVSVLAASVSDVPYFVIALGTDLDREYLTQLASATSGRFLEAPTPEALNGLYESIADLLRSQYLLTIDASAIASSQPMTLTVDVQAGEQRATASTLYDPGAGAEAPVLQVEGLQAGDAVSGPRVITVSAAGARPLTRVAFLVDDVTVFEVAEPPFAYTFDPSAFGDGAHSLSIQARAGAGTATASVEFSSVAPVPPDSGGLPLTYVAAGAGGLVAVLLLLVLLLKGRKPRVATTPVDQRITPWAQQILRKNAASAPVEVQPDEDPATVETVAEPLGVLISRAGSDLGQEYVVGGLPVSIGSGRRCAVRVDDPDLAAEEARTWVRGGHLMVHLMTRLTLIANDTPSGGWQILEPGDTFDVGSHRFEFKLLPVDQPAAAPAVTPNVMRDPVAPVPPPAISPVPAPGMRLSELMPHDYVEDGEGRPSRAS